MAFAWGGQRRKVAESLLHWGPGCGELASALMGHPHRPLTPLWPAGLVVSPGCRHLLDLSLEVEGEGRGRSQPPPPTQCLTEAVGPLGLRLPLPRPVRSGGS